MAAHMICTRSSVFANVFAIFKLNIWLVAAGHLSVSWSIEVQPVIFFCPCVSMVLLTPMGSPGVLTRCNCQVLIFASSRLFH